MLSAHIFPVSAVHPRCRVIVISLNGGAGTLMAIGQRREPAALPEARSVGIGGRLPDRFG